MEAQDSLLPLAKKFYKDGCIWTTVDGGLTQGDAMRFIKKSGKSKNYPIEPNQKFADWVADGGLDLENDIREFVGK